MKTTRILKDLAFTVSPNVTLCRSIHTSRLITSRKSNNKQYENASLPPSSFVTTTSLKPILKQRIQSANKVQKKHGYQLASMCTTATTKTTTREKIKAKLSPKAKLTLLYDGECPLCVKEVNMLRNRSEKYEESLCFIDIASDEFNEEDYGIDYGTAMGRIHAILPDGNLINGVRVFRLAYEAVGLGWVYAITKVKAVYWIAEQIYNVWADRRLQLTGRDTLDAIVRARKEKRSCR